MAEFNIRRLISGGLITNYFCTSRCRHCLYRCGPRWPKKYMNPETGEKSLRLIRKLGCRSVHIGGGEPMLRPDELGQILDAAARAGVHAAYVETNSSWFRDMASAQSVLSDLREKGLQTFLVSISPFHNEFVPFSKISGVMEACERTGISIFPWVADFIPDLSAFDPDTAHPLKDYEEKFGENYLLQILKRYWIHTGGRALDTFRTILPNKSPRQILAENRGGCAQELSDTSHFHIDLFGNYIPGLCSGLSISIDDLGKPLSEKEYPVLTTLFHSGIKGILALAQENFGYAPAREGYINKCDLCSEIRAFFVEQGFGGESELNPGAFYRF
ncbi:radical SAM protein [Desulfobacterales bacterium HSG2]|nr:radical SAM protein [Desulfobacterales bacterium HSG2]